jgi:formate dehydrogenase beta subunit
VAVDDDTLMSSQDGVFSSGDCVTGPKALIDAMGHGIHAAHSIDLYLRGEKMGLPETERLYRMIKAMNLPESPVDRIGDDIRCDLDQRPVLERIGDFNEIEQGYTPEVAIHEAQRCLRCYRVAMFVTEE